MSEHRESSFTNPNIAPVSRPEQGGSGVAEQGMAHSGTLPEQLRERPVNEFDNTSLSEAVERQLLQTPTSPASLPEAQPAPERKKSRKGLVIGVSASLAGVALVAGSIIGINASKSGPNAPEASPDPAPTEVVEEEVAPSTPEEFRAAYEASLLRGEKLAEHFMIPAGLGDQELGETIVARIDEWENYGANSKLPNWANSDFSESAPSLQEMVNEVAAENATSIKSALFTDSASPSLTGLPERMEHNNASTLGFFVQTFNDEESYRAWSEVTNVTATQLDANTRRLEITFMDYANTDKNRAHELGMTTARSAEGQQVVMNYTVVSDGEHERISDVS